MEPEVEELKDRALGEVSTNPGTIVGNCSGAPSSIATSSSTESEVLLSGTATNELCMVEEEPGEDEQPLKGENERQRKRVRRQVITAVIVFLTLLGASAYALWYFAPLLYRDEDLGFLPSKSILDDWKSRARPYVPEPRVEPEWQKQWLLYYDDDNNQVLKAWHDKFEEHSRRRHPFEKEYRDYRMLHPLEYKKVSQVCLSRYQKSLEIATFIGNKHDDQYIAALLRQAKSLEAIARGRESLALAEYFASNHGSDGRQEDRMGDKKELIGNDYWKAYKIHRSVLGKTHPNTLRDLSRIGQFYKYNEQNDQAKRIYQYGLKLAVDAFGIKSTESGLYAGDLIHVDLSQYESFENGYFPGAFHKNPQPRFYPHYAMIGLNDAEYYNLAAKVFSEKSIKADPSEDITFKQEAARSALFRGEPNEADSIYRKLLKLIAARHGMHSSYVRCLAECYCCTLETEGRFAEAQRIRNKLEIKATDDRAPEEPP